MASVSVISIFGLVVCIIHIPVFMQTKIADVYQKRGNVPGAIYARVQKCIAAPVYIRIAGIVLMQGG